MTPAPQNHVETAANWFTRLRETATDADWQAFTGWLEADEAHRLAYDAVERAWVEVEDYPEAWAAPAVAAVQPARRRWLSWPIWAGAAATAAVALTVTLSLQPSGDRIAEDFKTDAGTTRVVSLADGSELAMNRSTAVSVRLQPDRRDVDLAEGEVSFDVAPDHERPFYVEAGGREVRVVGTEFNVMRDGDRLVVTVRRGKVTVEDKTTHAVSTLEPGMQASLDGGAQPAVISRVDANDAFAWRQGNLIYRDTPLALVAADLSRYFGKPVRVADAANAIRVSGVLQISEQAAMLRRLELFVPIVTQVSGDEIVLAAR